MVTDSNTATAAAPSIWLPLRSRVFRALWLAVLGSQIGTWMQTVGAQWLLVDQPNAPTLVSLVQTAIMLPMLLLALPAGVLADALDRRRMLIVVQWFQAAIGAVADRADVRRPDDTGAAADPDVRAGLRRRHDDADVPGADPGPRPARAADRQRRRSGAISMNLARAVGPAAAGVLIAQVGPAAVFALNAASFVAFAVVLLLWRRHPTGDAAEPEPFVAALRAGGRYVRHSAAMRRFLLRVALFILPGVALWALLPLVASQRLEHGRRRVRAAARRARRRRRRRRARHAAPAGAAVRQPAAGDRQHACTRARWPSSPWCPTPSWSRVALVPAGMAWMTVLANVNAIVQMFLPRWVRARGLGAYQLVFFGGQALGALAWGLVAERIGLVDTFLAAAVLTALCAATVADGR